jgi:hypothetical protein
MSLVVARLREVTGQGRRAYEATLMLDCDEPEAIAAVIGRFRCLLRGAIRTGKDVKYRAFLHACGDRVAGPHYHVLVHSGHGPKEARGIVQGLWFQAVGHSMDRFHFGVVGSLEATARYFTRDLDVYRRGVAAAQLLKRDIPVAPAFGNFFFGRGGQDALRKKLASDRRRDASRP